MSDSLSTAYQKRMARKVAGHTIGKILPVAGIGAAVTAYQVAGDLHTLKKATKKKKKAQKAFESQMKSVPKEVRDTLNKRWKSEGR